MATDITKLLMQMIRAGSTQADGLAVNSSVLGSTADLLSLTANYAQLLGTASPAVQAALAVIVSDAAIQAGSSAAEATAIASVITSSAFGAVVVLGATLVAAILISVGGPDRSDQAQLLKALGDAINNLTEVQLAIYWQDKMAGSLSILWSPLGTDLDNLASEGTGGTDVRTDVSHFHDHALAFVNHLVKDIGWDQYWQVLAQPAGDVPQSSSGPPFLPNNDFGWTWWTFLSWYGQFPPRLTVAGSPSGNVSDPRTIAPVLALGIQSFLILESLLNFIDSTQPALQQFVNSFSEDLQSYTRFLYGMYAQAVNGIVKTDLPSDDEILGALWWITQSAGVFAHPSTDPNRDTSESWGAPVPLPRDQPVVAFSGNGWAWNRLYGASETYPQYGFYGTAQLDQTQQTIFTPAYVVTSLLEGGTGPANNVVSEWQHAGFFFKVDRDIYVWINEFQSWTIPWIKNRIILGRMARWKAIYLLNAFDGVWSVLQALQRLAAPNPPIVPSTMFLKQDNTIADGNWSARELCKVVQVNAKLLTGNGYVSEDNEFVIDWVPNFPVSADNIAWTRVSGHSVAGLVGVLYNVANGNWAGPPALGLDVTAPKPLSFRGLLAGAAA